MKHRVSSLLARFSGAAAVLLLAVSALQAAPTPEVYRNSAVARPALDNIGDYVANPRPTYCKTDADCKDPNPDDCKGHKCVPYKSEVNPVTGEVTEVGKCSEYDIPNCRPPQDCNELHKGDPYAIKCCGAGFSQAADPAAFKCCSEHVSHGEDPGTPENPVPCRGDCPKCPDCPPIPKIDCNLVGDPKMKACCEEKGGLLWFVMAGCIDKPDAKEGCTNWAEHVTNSGVFQQCCLINYGVIEGDINMCNNVTGGGPGGGTTGGTPTTPSGSAPALGTCTVTPASSDVIAGKEFAFGKDWVVSYSAPSGIGPVASVRLTKVKGVEITVDEAADPTGGWIKMIADPSSLPPFSVHTPKPPEAITQEKEQAQFRVRLQLKDLADNDLASMECDNAGFYEGMGGAGCGCDLTARLSGRNQVLAYLVMALIFAAPAAALRLARKKR
jgi:hypothetical protein